MVGRLRTKHSCNFEANLKRACFRFPCRGKFWNFFLLNVPVTGGRKTELTARRPESILISNKDFAFEIMGVGRIFSRVTNSGFFQRIFSGDQNDFFRDEKW